MASCVILSPMAPNAQLVQVKILFFAKARELLNQSESVISLNKESSIDNVFEAIETSYPDLKALNRTYAIALNEEYLPNDLDLILNFTSNDQIAVIPPISGG